MSIMDLSAANPALKEFYDDQYVQNLVYKKNPALALIAKNTKAGGKYFPVPVVWENSQGISATFANAQGNQTPAQIAEFLVTRKKDYSIATIDNETLEASATDKMSFLQQSTLLIDAAIKGSTNSAASGLFRDGTGTIGTIATGGITSGVITLTNAADVVQFAVNQTLQANSTSGGTPRTALGYVIARSVKAGTVTVASSGLGGSAGSPSGWAAGDSLLVQGNNNAKWAGFPAWLPTTDPTSSDNFYGVNRSSDPRLYGVSYDGSGQPIEEALIDGSLLLEREGSATDTCIMSVGTKGALSKALGAKRQYVDLQGPAKISFRGIQVDGGATAINCFADRNCQVKRGFLLEIDSWKIISLGDVPKILRYSDGNDMLRVYNGDSAECRVGYYANLTCNAPGLNGQIIFGA